MAPPSSQADRVCTTRPDATTKRRGIAPVGPPTQIVHRGDEERFEQEACFPVGVDTATDSEIVVRDLDAGPAAVLRHSGALDDGQLIVHSVMAWIRGRGHEPVMPFRVALFAMPPLFTLPVVADASQPVFEITVPYR